MMSRQAAESRVTVQKALVIDACIAICTVAAASDDVRKILLFNFSSPSRSVRGQKGPRLKSLTAQVQELGLKDCGHQDRQRVAPVSSLRNRSRSDSMKRSTGGEGSMGNAVSLSGCHVGVGRVSQPVVLAVNIGKPGMNTRIYRC